MNIQQFNIGDEIVRVEPSECFGDRSYIGEKLTYKGILNGMIYFTKDDIFVNFNLNNRLSLPLDVWSNGWEKYVDPNTLYDDTLSIDKYTEEEILKQIKLAIECENYELAEILKNKLNK
jgi:hypothetical protein